MRYRLRTLLILLAVGPMVLGALWPLIQPWLMRREHDELETFRKPVTGILMEQYDPRTRRSDSEELLSGPKFNP
jgi:hypothetical protein